MDPVSLALGITAFVTAVGSSVAGVISQKQIRQAQQLLKNMQLQAAVEAANQNIDEMERAQKNQILLNIAVGYKKGMTTIDGIQSEQKKSVIFFSIAAISTAVFIREMILRHK